MGKKPKNTEPFIPNEYRVLEYGSLRFNVYYLMRLSLTTADIIIFRKKEKLYVDFTQPLVK